MKPKRTALSFLLLLSMITCYAQPKKGVEEIKAMIDGFNTRLEKTKPEDGFFLVIQHKDDDRINFFKIYYYTYTLKDKKLEYQLNAANESDSSHFFASVVEDGKVLKIQYSAAETRIVYLVKKIGDALQLFDENGTLLFPPVNDNAAKPGASANTEKALTTADVMPKPAFDLGAYLGENLHYPEKARLRNKEGRVLVKFVVNEDGSISDAELLRGFNDECDEEALRVVRNMPNWIPGKVDGKNVKVYFTLPLRFKLTD